MPSGGSDSAEEGIEGSDTAEPDTGTPVDPGIEPGEAQWSLDEVQSAIEQTLDAGFFGPQAIRGVFLERMAHGDGRCPDSLVQISDHFVFGCTTDDGWWFAGIATYEEYDLPEPWEGTGEEWALSGDFEIIDPDGPVFRVGGETGRDQPSDGVWQGKVQGSWTQEDHAPPWIAGGISAMLTVTGSLNADASKAVLHGGLGIGETSLYFEHLRWKEGGCWEHPTGTIMVRDPSQYWWSLTLDDDCTGCGMLSYASGESMREVCPDLGPLRDDILSDVVPQ